MELKTYVCPNCGANTTNAQNCEYCGSLLVRFVEKGIDLSHTSYTNNDAVFPGLIGELKRNLKLYEEDEEVGAVSTDLFKSRDGYYDHIQITQGIGQMDMIKTDEEGHIIGVESVEGLCITLDFGRKKETLSNKEENDRMDSQLLKFKQLDSFSLFRPHIHFNPNTEYYARTYTINFGRDAEGAARLVSEILMKVYGWSLNEPFDLFTNGDVEGDEIDTALNEWCIAHGFEPLSGSAEDSSDDSSYNEEEASNSQDEASYNSNEEREYPNWQYWVAGGLALLLLLFKIFF